MSEIAAIALEESDWRSLTIEILAAPCATTAFDAFEAVLALARQTTATPSQAHADVLELVAKLAIDVVPFGPEMITHAVAARERYGRGRKGSTWVIASPTPPPSSLA